MRLLGRSLFSRRLLAVLVAGAFLVGCGSETDSSGRDPGLEPDSDSDVIAPETVEILSGVATGGSTEQGVVRLDTPDGVAELTRDLTRPQLARAVRRVVRETEVPDGMALVGAIVSVGCDVPSDIAVTGGGEEPMELEPVWTGVTRLPECFAPVTSIGIVLVDEDDLPKLPL